MRILYLAQRVPYPPHRGDKITNFNYVRHLARSHEVVVACLADGRKDLENKAGLTPLVAAVEAVPVSKTRARLRALAALAGGKRPLTPAYFDEPELHRRIEGLMAGGGFDLALVSNTSVAPYAEPL